MLLIGNLLIAPLLAAIAPAAVTAVGSLLGGVLNTSAQSRANQMNLQATRETNAMTEELAREQMSRQESQFQRQLAYLSPKEQRRMLEEAGFSPMAYLNGGQTSSAGTPHSGVAQSFQSPHVEPVTALGDSLQQISANIRNIAEARKLESEKKGQDLTNETFMAQFEKTMEALGYSNKIAEVKAKYSGQEEEQFYQSLVNQNLMAAEEIERVKIANDIQSYYHKNIQPKELQQLIDNIQLIREQSATQENLRNYYDSAAKAGLQQAAAHTLLAKIEQKYSYNKNMMYGSQAELNSALAGESSQRYVGLNIENEIKKLTGKPIAMAQLRSLIKGGNLSEAMAEKVWKENKKLQKEINWYEFNSLVGAARSVAGTAEEAMFIKALW